MEWQYSRILLGCYRTSCPNNGQVKLLRNLFQRGFGNNLPHDRHAFSPCWSRACLIGSFQRKWDKWTGCTVWCRSSCWPSKRRKRGGYPPRWWLLCTIVYRHTVLNCTLLPTRMSVIWHITLKTNVNWFTVDVGQATDIVLNNCFNETISDAPGIRVVFPSITRTCPRVQRCKLSIS